MRVSKRLMLIAGLGALAARRLPRTPYDLQGKSVLITGGARGLGLAMARQLVMLGARVTLVSRTADELARAAQELRAAGGAVEVVQADLTTQAGIDHAVEAAARARGGLDVLINNASIIQASPLDNLTEADFRSIMEINAMTPLRMTRAALPLLRARRGRVLIIGSVGGKAAIPRMASYSMSKFAVVGLGQALRLELAREGVTVTTVLPGLMQTGGARHTIVKGQVHKEYTLFATLDHLPGLSMGATEAARRILSALVRGDAEVMIGGPALLLRYAQALAPQLTADLMALTNRVLPRPGTSNRAVTGADVETPLTRANPLKRAAEARYNEG